VKFFKNKLAGITILVAIFLVIFYTIISAMGQTLIFGNLLGTLATPFRYGFRAVGNAFGGFADYVTEFRSLQKENEQMAERITELEKQTAHVKVLEGENAWLRGYLGMKEELTDFDLIDATVIGREANSYMTLYTLNKGALHGVKVDMSVVTDSGIVGRVETVGANWCHVSAITENASSVGAVCARSGARGIVDGSLGLRDKGMCAMNYIDEFADVEVGDVILSSGSGGVYPYGFVIGTVTEITHDENARTLSAIIEPAVNPDTTTRVMIVGKMTKSAETAE
jgi:rod shape-determining protein MreC